MKMEGDLKEVLNLRASIQAAAKQLGEIDPNARYLIWRDLHDLFDEEPRDPEESAA